MRRAGIAIALPAMLLVFLFLGGCGSSYSSNSNTGTPSALYMSSITPPNGQVGTVYATQTITVSGGTSPYTATPTGLPPGLSLTPNYTGTVLTISGTPTTAPNHVIFT